MADMIHDIKDILFSEDKIQKRVQELGVQISKDYVDKSPILIGILKGSFIFLADLARHININCEFRFVTAASYGFSSISSGNVRIGATDETDFKDRHLILVEDILDSGNTISALHEYVMGCKPTSLKTCAFLDKPARREHIIEVDYLGFKCPNEFVVGYGLDFAERYRNLPYIAILKPEIFADII
jgi:hypoxanthine phosphoribosyltransferase